MKCYKIIVVVVVVVVAVVVVKCREVTLVAERSNNFEKLQKAKGDRS